MAGALLIWATLGTLSAPMSARAQFLGKASATGQFESNSNVFSVDAGFKQPGTGAFDRGDTFYSYGAAFDGKYRWSRQEFYAAGSTSEYDYQRFKGLNHNDYRFDAGLNWKLGELLDGNLDVARTHAMVPFFDLVGSELALSVVTEQKETVQIGLKLSSNWKIDGTGYKSNADQPLPNAPNLQLAQTFGAASIEYLGYGGLTSGLTAGYLKGDYTGSNVTLNPSFNQSTVGLLAKYKHYRSTFEGQVGYSRRVSATGTDNTSGVTGLIDFKQQLTPKTSYSAKIDRKINSYFLNSSSEIDTDAGATIDWQATYKLTGSVGYAFTYREFPKQGNNPIGSDRVDIQEYATFRLSYQPRRWLLIRPYANVQTRRSTFIGAHFSSTIFGVYVTISTPDRPR